MKSFLIALKDHKKSEYFANIALTTALEYGWNLERFDAIDGRKVPLNFLKSKNLKVNQSHKKFIKQFERPGVLGCFMSHYTLWKNCVDLNETIGIFEEDVLFRKEMPTNFDFLDVLKLEKKKQGKEYVSGNWWEGAYAYILSPSGAKKLLDWVDANGILPADVILGTKILNVEFNLDHLVTLNTESLSNNNSMSTTQNRDF